MKTRLLPVLVAASLCLLAVLLLIRRHPQGKLVYQGKSLDVWVSQISSPDAQTRDQAGIALKTMGSAAIPRLTALLQVKDSLYSEQLWPLVRKIPAARRSFFQRFIHPPRAAATRSAAATGLGILNTNAAPAIPALATALRDPANEVRWAAASALSRIGKAAVPSLIDALQDGDSRVRHASVYALGQIGCEAEAAVPALIRLLADPVATVRPSTIASLCNIGQAAIAPLIEVVEKGTGLARQGAAQALIQLHPSPRMAPPLLSMVRDTNADSRVLAINSLGMIHAGDAHVVTALAEALKDPVAAVRLAAASGLAQLGPRAQASIPALTQALADESPSVREEAATALGRLGVSVKPVTPDRVRTTNDSPPSIRAADKPGPDKPTGTPGPAPSPR